MTINNTLPGQVVHAIRSVVGDGRVGLHEPTFKGKELEYLTECIDSTYVSSVGKFVDRFERDLEAFTGSKHAIVVVNGTAALHVALKLGGVISDDEVLLPALTFIATANAIVYCNAHPHFVDSSEDTFGLDPYSLRGYLNASTEMRQGRCVNRKTGRIIRAVVPMHTFGHPIEIEELLSVANDFNLTVIEDAAESLGSYVEGRHTGTFGLLGTLSFNGNKTITTGGGGAVLTNDDGLAKRAKHITTTAKIAHRWNFGHDEVGFNYRMPNINAALGCAQLEVLPNILVTQRSLFEKYSAAFSGVTGVRVAAEPNGCNSNYWLQTLILDDENAFQKDDILTATNEIGLMTRPVWGLMHRQRMFVNKPCGPLNVSEALERRLVNIPSSPLLVGKE